MCAMDRLIVVRKPVLIEELLIVLGQGHETAISYEAQDPCSLAA